MFVDFNILNQLGSPSINSNTFANRPAAGQTGRLFVSTDTFEIYRDNGTTWDLIGGPGSSTITGTGTATQVAYFTSSQAIGSSANLFWDNTNTRLGVGTASPGYTIEANGSIKANSVYLTGATGGSGALYWTSDRVTVANYNVGGIVLIETNGGATAATFGADLTATFVSGIGTRGYTGSTSYGALFNGSVGINTATPGAALDVHSTGTIAQFNTTSATGNTYIAFQRTGTSLWRIGDTYNAGNNFFELHNTVLGVDAMEFEAATNKSAFQAQQTYTTGLARGNYFDFNLSVAAGGSFSSPNAITALGASLDLTLAGNATIPSGARSGLDAYNSIAFTGAGTLTHTQGTQIRAYSNVTAGWAFNGSAVGTITHLAGLRALFPDNSGSAVNVTNNYALLLNDQTANTGTVTYTNRWGVYQEGASDTNYFNGTTLVGTSTNSGFKFDVLGAGRFFSSTAGNFTALTLTNSSNSSSARNILTFFNDTGSVGSIDTFSSTWSTSGGDDAANGLRVLAPGSGGLSLRASTNTIRFYTGSSQRAIIDANGSLGLGVTPSAWGSAYKAFQFGNSSAAVSALFSNGVNDFWAVSNVYFDGANFRYINTGTATGHEQVNGTFLWNIAPSGSAGSIASFTQYMKLDASGRLGIGTSAPNARLHVSAASTNQIIQLERTGSGAGSGYIYANANDLFGVTDNSQYPFLVQQGSSTNALTIAASSNILIGKSTDAGQKLQVNGTANATQFNSTSGTVSVPVSTNTTFFTPTTVGLYMAHVYLSGNATQTWDAVIIFAFNATNILVVNQTNSANVSTVVSGTNIQVNQTGATTYTFNYEIIKIA